MIVNFLYTAGARTPKKDALPITLPETYDIGLPNGWTIEKTDGQQQIDAHGPVDKILAANVITFIAKKNLVLKNYRKIMNFMKPHYLYPCFM